MVPMEAWVETSFLTIKQKRIMHNTHPCHGWVVGKKLLRHPSFFGDLNH